MHIIQCCPICYASYPNVSRYWCRSFRKSLKIYKYYISMFQSRDTTNMSYIEKIKHTCLIDKYHKKIQVYRYWRDNFSNNILLRIINLLTYDLSYESNWPCKRCYLDMNENKYKLFLLSKLPLQDAAHISNTTLKSLAVNAIEPKLLIELLNTYTIDIKNLF